MTTMRCLLLLTLFARAASAQTDSQTSKIVPAYSVAPSVFQIGQTPNVLLSLTNQNPSAVEQLQPGDVFTFTLGVPGAAFTGASTSAVVNSSSFLQSDFSIWMGPGPNQVQITYLGPAAPFPVGDTIAVKTTVISSQVGAGTLSLQTPPERYVAAQSPSLNISAVDFPVAPPGPPGPVGPIGVTGAAGPGGLPGPPGLAGPFGPQGPAGPGGFPGPIGPIGAQGPAGVSIVGPGGSQGPQGVPGATGATGLTFRNAWNLATSYQVSDAVFYSGASYISLSASNTGNTPSNGAPWALLAQQGSIGATGATGTTGSVGPAGPPGAAGSPGLAGTNGTNGMNGMMGAPGSTGPAGGQNTLIAARYNAGVPGTSYANYLFANSNESAVFSNTPYFSPVACTLRSFAVTTGVAIPSGVTLTVNLRTSSTLYPVDISTMVDSGTVTCTVASGASSCNAGAATQSIAMGEAIEIKMVVAGSRSFSSYVFPSYTCN